jgi:hypothetical protein
MARSRKTRRAELKEVQARGKKKLALMDHELKVRKAERRAKTARQRDRVKSGGLVNKVKNKLDL